MYEALFIREQAIKCQETLRNIAAEAVKPVSTSVFPIIKKK